MKNSQGIAEVCNYIVKYNLKIYQGLNDVAQPIYVYCSVEVPVKVTPVTNPSQVTAPVLLNEVTTRYNSIKNSLINLPGMTEAKICDIAFGVVSILFPEKISSEEVVSIRNVYEKDFLKNASLMMEHVQSNFKKDVSYYWVYNEKKILYEINVDEIQIGDYDLYVFDNTLVSNNIFNLKIIEQNEQKIAHLKDMISPEDYDFILNNLDSASLSHEFYRNSETIKNDEEIQNIQNDRINSEEEIIDISYNINENKVELSVFPNPIDNYFSVLGLDKPDLINLDRITVISTLGEIIYEKEINIEEMYKGRIYIDNISVGLYFLTFYSNGRVLEQIKLIKK